MIISKTPLRIPLAGGLSDLKPYVDRFGGVTVSSTIDQYIYVCVKADTNGYYDLKYLDVHEKVVGTNQIENDLIREAIKLTGLDRVHLDMTIMGDLTTDSGLGSSGAVTIGVLNALHRYKNEQVDPVRLFKEASKIEVDILEGASGYHDPAISALGGLRIIEYHTDGLETRSLKLGKEALDRFSSSLLFFYSGVHNKSKPSLHILMSQMESALPILHRIKEIGYELVDALESGDLRKTAEIIGEQQDLKQRLPGNFYDEYVDSITNRIKRHGAFAQLPGGKVSAFIIVCCPDGQHESVRKELSEYAEVEMNFVQEGSTVTEF